MPLDELAFFSVFVGDRLVVGYGEARKWWKLARSRSVIMVMAPSPTLGFRPVLIV